MQPDNKAHLYNLALASLYAALAALGKQRKSIPEIKAAIDELKQSKSYALAVRWLHPGRVLVVYRLSLVCGAYRLAGGYVDGL